MTDLIVPVAKLATAKAVPEGEFKTLNESLATGTLPVDVSIRIRGALKKGDPFKQTIAAAIDPWRLLRKALGKLNGVTLEALVEEALLDATEPEEIKLATKKALERMIASTERAMPGRLTAALTWELLA